MIDSNKIRKEGIKRYSHIKEQYYYELYKEDFPELFKPINSAKQKVKK